MQNFAKYPQIVFLTFSKEIPKYSSTDRLLYVYIYYIIWIIVYSKMEFSMASSFLKIHLKKMIYRAFPTRIRKEGNPT